MTDRMMFGEQSSKFFTGLNAAQLDGTEEFSISEQFASLRITHTHAFTEKASRLFDATDKAIPVSDTEPMTNITRDEFSAKLETIETKMDARSEAVSAKIDAFVAVQAERDKRMEAMLSQISASHSEIKTSIGSIKTSMILTAISTVLAIVIGIAGFNAMLTSNMVASFQMGRSEQAYQKSAEPAATPPAQAPASPKP